MKLQIPIIACLLAALPAAALADPHNDHTYSSHASAPARSYQSVSRYTRQPARYSQTPRYSEQAPRNVQPMPRYQQRPAQYVQQRYTPDVQVYPRYAVRSPWAWNGGRVWVASSGYWGGGFWGPLTIGLAFNDYQVQPSSPGAQLLANYGLQQTDCDQPNLVDIIGPDGSQICAYPNDEVAPGQYQVDPSTLTLVSD